jgi:arylsulfatase A-like enzyme
MKPNAPLWPVILITVATIVYAPIRLHAADPRSSVSGDQHPAASPKPNILFLLSDDHSNPFLSCYGNPNVKTPTLDQFAAEGMKFHRFFTTAPQCVPSRASLLTGRSPVAARISRFSSPLPRDEVTFPELLRTQADYYTGVCGRQYHLDGSVPRTDDTALADLLTKHGLKTFSNRVDYLDVSRGEGVEKKVIEFLDRKPVGKPFFLWVNYNNPHHPWNEMTARPAPESLALPPHWPDLPGLRGQIADYFGEINRLDLQVKAVLDVLDQRGFRTNTLVVFLGDNGAALPHGKGSLYDPGCNVPCLVRWPGVVKAGRESRALLSGEDLGPTLLAAASLPAPARMTGISFLPLLRGEPFTPRQYLFTERGPHGSASVTVNMKNNGYDLSRAVRSDRYKLIYNCTPWIPYAPVDSAGGPGWLEMIAANTNDTLAPELRATYFATPRPVYELYDLDADPSELHNLSGQPGVRETERELRLALAEKMITDFDYVPLPAIPAPALAVSGTAARSSLAGDRAALFDKRDINKDGRLSLAEFSAGRAPAEAQRLFRLRDANRDSFLSREEFIPRSPLPERNP